MTVLDELAGPCQLCGTGVAAYDVTVADEPGSGWVMINPRACPACVDLIQGGAYAELAARLQGWEDSPAIADRIGRHLVSISPIPEQPTEIARLWSQGYRPLHGVTGVGADLGPLWPEGLTLQLPVALEEDDDFLWYVRSPWPSITVAEVIELLWPWVERPPFDPADQDVWAKRTSEVLRWPGERAAEWLAECRRNRS